MWACAASCLKMKMYLNSVQESKTEQTFNEVWYYFLHMILIVFNSVKVFIYLEIWFYISQHREGGKQL